MNKKIKNKYKVEKYIEVYGNVENLYIDIFKYFNKLLEEFFIYDYADDCFFEGWEDLKAMNLEVDIVLGDRVRTMGECGSNDETILISYKLVLIEYKSDILAPNNVLREKIIKFFNKDFEKQFKKFVEIYVFDGVDYFDKDKNRIDTD